MPKELFYCNGAGEKSALATSPLNWLSHIHKHTAATALEAHYSFTPSHTLRLCLSFRASWSCFSFSFSFLLIKPSIGVFLKV